MAHRYTDCRHVAIDSMGRPLPNAAGRGQRAARPPEQDAAIFAASATMAWATSSLIGPATA
jgi:hypothetical protein